MAVRTGDISRLGDAPDQGRESSASSATARIGPTLVLTMLLGATVFGLAMPVVMAIISPTDIGILGTQHQNAESMLYLGTFAILLPAALIAATRVADRIVGGPSRAGLDAMAWLLSALLAVMLLFARASSRLPWDDGRKTVFALALIFGAVLALSIWRATRPAPWRALLALDGRAVGLGVGALVLAVVAIPVAFVALGSLNGPVTALGAALIAAIVLLWGRRRIAPLPAHWGLVADVVILVIICLAIPNVVVVRPQDASNDFLDNYRIGIVQYHQDFILGPAHEVVSGGSVLVDTASQYGVGPVYLLAGWFGLTNEGYGTYAFLDGILYALFFSAGYLILRMAGVSRLLAASTLGVAVLTLTLNLAYPIGGLPQQGPLRFGLPMGLILFTVLGAARPRHFKAARFAGYAVIGISAIWALEALAYTLATFAGIVIFEALEIERSKRFGFMARRAAGALVACVTTQVLFLIATLIRSGELPDWGQYLAFLDQFLFKKLGDLTYDFSSWSGGFAVGAFYFAAAAALILILWRHRGIVGADRTAYLALAGLSAFGVTLFSYFVDRSSDAILPAVCFPALLLGTIWLSLILRNPGTAVRLARGSLAAALAISLVVVSAAWSSVDNRVPETLLAQALPGGSSLRDSMHRLWHLPALNPATPAGELLVDATFPGDERIPIIASPDVQTEILMRTGHTDYFHLTDGWEDSFVEDQHLAEITEAVAALKAGDLMLVSEGAQEAFAMVRASNDPATILAASTAGDLASLQTKALAQIGKRFSLRPVRTAPGFAIVRLVPNS